METTTEQLLDAYMHYVPEEGIAFERFVEHGAFLLGPKTAQDLEEVLAEVRIKIDQLRPKNPLLGRRLALLADLLGCTYARVPEKTRSEMAFALVYTVKAADLVPDHMPDGYVDDAAVVEAVFTRHAPVLQEHCANYGHEWCTLKP